MIQNCIRIILLLNLYGRNASSLMFNVRTSYSDELIPNLKRMISRYFYEEKIVTIVEDVDIIPFSLLNLQPFGFTVLNYKSIYSMPSQKTNGSIIGYSSLHGYLKTCNGFEDCYTFGLSPISYRNPTAKIMLITQDMDVKEITRMFQLAWNNFKILNLMTLNIERKVAFLYNPFNNQLISINMTSEYNFKNFLVRRLQNVKGYPLRLNVYNASLMCRVRKNRRFELACSELLYAVKKLCNFTLVYVVPSDNTTFGFISTNKTFMGSLGEIEYNKADIAADLRIIANFDTSRNLYFLNALLGLKYCFVVPKDFYPFTFQVFPHRFIDFYTFILVVLSLFLLIFLNHCMNKLAEREDAIILDHRQSFAKVTLIYFSLYCNVSIKTVPIRFYARIMIGCFLVFNLILANSYQGSIITQLNQKGTAGNIYTLQQLLDSGLKIRIPSGPDKYIRNFALFPKGSIQKRLSDKKIITETDSEPQIVHAAYKREASIMCPNHYIHYYKVKYLNNITGESLIHMVPECVYEYYMSVMVPKSSPFIKRFNQIIQMMNEAGTINYQYSKGMSELQLAYIRLVKKGTLEEKTVKLLGMEELSLLFIWYSVWLVIIFAVFLLELFIKKIKYKILSFCNPRISINE